MPEHVKLLSEPPMRAKHKVPFDFAQGRLSTPQITTFAVICCGRNDRVAEFGIPTRAKSVLEWATIGSTPFTVWAMQ
jgi:hypothetical protein